MDLTSHFRKVKRPAPISSDLIKAPRKRGKPTPTQEHFISQKQQPIKTTRVRRELFKTPQRTDQVHLRDKQVSSTNTKTFINNNNNINHDSTNFNGDLQLEPLSRPLPHEASKSNDEFNLISITATSTIEATPPTTPKIRVPTRTKQPTIEVPISPVKIIAGPLKGVSSSLLDHIRAKEAASKATTPEQIRQRELLGIAPAIARIVPTIFIANKREVMLYDKVVEKCFKGLKSNYTTLTIIECLDLMDKVAPEWVSVVKISRGTFMRLNKDKYSIPTLLEAIKSFSRKISPTGVSSPSKELKT